MENETLEDVEAMEDTMEISEDLALDVGEEPNIVTTFLRNFNGSI